MYNGNVTVYVVDNGSVDGTTEYIRSHRCTYIRHESNLGIFAGTMSGWNAAAAGGHEYIVNVQSDFPSIRPLPLGSMESYLDRNRDVGFIRLNQMKDRPKNIATRQPVEFRPWELLDNDFSIAKYNYHMAFHPYFFRASLVDYLCQAPLRTELGLMRRYEELGLLGARLRPACFRTLPYNRHATPGWLP